MDRHEKNREQNCIECIKSKDRVKERGKKDEKRQRRKFFQKLASIQPQHNITWKVYIDKTESQEFDWL